MSNMTVRYVNEISLAELAREKTRKGLQILWDIATDEVIRKERPDVALKAIGMIFDRAYGKAKQVIEVDHYHKMSQQELSTVFIRSIGVDTLADSLRRLGLVDEMLAAIKNQGDASLINGSQKRRLSK